MRDRRRAGFAITHYGDWSLAREIADAANPLADRTVLVGYEAVVAVTWETGQHQPDRVAAAVVAYDVLAHPVGQQMHVVTPMDTARRAREGKMPPPPAWMTRRISHR